MYRIPLLLLAIAACNSPESESTTPEEPVVAAPTPDPLAPVLRSTPPSDVDPIVHGKTITPEQARPFFDTFSWQSFVAFAWPAQPGAVRGIPMAPDDPQTLLSDAGKGTTVFESFRTVTDLFPADQASAPTFTPPDYDAPTPSVCGNAGPDALVLEQLTKGAVTTTVGDGEVSEAFSGPLVDQWGSYSRYQIHVGRAEYDFIDTNKFYLAANQPQSGAPGFPIKLPPESAPEENSVEVKSAWRPMVSEALDGRPADDLSRYLVRDAYLVSDGHTPGADCTIQAMGLVGLHVAVKTPTQPRWIWGTFEQVDNVQVGPGAAAGTLPSYNDGHPSAAVLAAGYDVAAAAKDGITGTPPSIAWNNDILDAPVPIAIARINAIPTGPALPTTVDLNAQWQQALAGTPLAYYELVVTQWATDNSTYDPTGSSSTAGDYPSKAGQPFPTYGALNTTMETYFQTTNVQPDHPNAGDSCMECHYGAASADMSWMLKNRAQ